MIFEVYHKMKVFPIEKLHISKELTEKGAADILSRMGRRLIHVDKNQRDYAPGGLCGAARGGAGAASWRFTINTKILYAASSKNLPKAPDRTKPHKGSSCLS